MYQVKRCTTCHIPLQLSRMNVWNNDGTITQVHNPDHRLFFYDAAGFDRLFGNIARKIGISIDAMVVESRRKATLDYIDALMSGPRGLALRTFQRLKAYSLITTMGALMGYGHFEFRDFKPGNYIKVYGESLYCETLVSADLIAIFNYLEGHPADLLIEHEGLGKLFTVKRGTTFGHEPTSRLEYRKIPRKPGNLSIERCPECGLPSQFKDFSWFMGRGVMTDRKSGRDMVLMGPNEIDSIFLELETELGPEINRAIVEGQCRYVREELQDRETSRDGVYLTRQLALRGMGNLVRFELSREKLNAVVENASPYLMVAGLMQGVYEAVNGQRSRCDYRLGDDGTLFVEVGKSKTTPVEAPAGLEA